MTYLYLKADIFPDLSKVDEVRAAYQELVNASLTETGCLLYDLVVSEDSPNTWHMFEKWGSKALWDEHMQSEHVKRLRALEPGLVLQPTVLNFYTPVL